MLVKAPVRLLVVICDMYSIYFAKETSREEKLCRILVLLYRVKSELGFLSAPTSVKNRSEVAQTWLFVYLESSCSLTLNGKHQKPHADCSMELRLLTATVSPVRPVEAAQLMLQNTR